MNKLQKIEYEKAIGSTKAWKEGTQEALLKEFAKLNGFTANISGDACIGDEVVFAAVIWGGSFKKPRFNGVEIKTGTITKDSYGTEKQQHSFTIKTKASSFRVMGRNLYKFGTWAKPRKVEEREEVLNEKHKRGTLARSHKKARITACFA